MSKNSSHQCSNCSNLISSKGGSDYCDSDDGSSKATGKRGCPEWSRIEYKRNKFKGVSDE